MTDTPERPAAPGPAADPVLDPAGVAYGRRWKRVDDGPRVGVLLQFAPAADAARVLTAVLERLAGSPIGRHLVGGHSYRMAEDDEATVYLVVPGDAHGESRSLRPAVYVDADAAAHEHARGVGGLVVEADVVADYRTPAETTGPVS